MISLIIIAYAISVGIAAGILVFMSADVKKQQLDYLWIAVFGAVFAMIRPNLFLLCYYVWNGNFYAGLAGAMLYYQFLPIGGFIAGGAGSCIPWFSKFKKIKQFLLVLILISLEVVLFFLCGGNALLLSN